MARGYNRSIIMGNLARDPVVRYTQSKTAVASFTVASNRSVKDGDSYKDVADYIPVVVWDKLAENAEKFLKKGSGVLVEGRIQTRSYEDQQGNKKYVTEVVANNMIFLPTGAKKQNIDDFAAEHGELDISDNQAGGDGEEGDADIPF